MYGLKIDADIRGMQQSEKGSTVWRLPARWILIDESYRIKRRISTITIESTLYGRQYRVNYDDTYEPYASRRY